MFLPRQTSLQGLREALREVTVLGNYRHQHLVPLVSFSLSRQGGQQEACLVYPLMPGGALDCALANRTARPLGAAARLRIAADAAAGLAYLHAPGGGLAALLHRDVKSSNVLLDAGLRARVSDVGLARPQQLGVSMTGGVGTCGYIDPEYLETGELPVPVVEIALQLSNFSILPAAKIFCWTLCNGSLAGSGQPGFEAPAFLAIRVGAGASSRPMQRALPARPPTRANGIGAGTSCSSGVRTGACASNAARRVRARGKL